MRLIPIGFWMISLVLGCSSGGPEEHETNPHPDAGTHADASIDGAVDTTADAHMETDGAADGNQDAHNRLDAAELYANSSCCEAWSMEIVAAQHVYKNPW